MKCKFDYELYGIKIGQKYKAADGSKNILIVYDVLTYASCGDVIVFDQIQGIERRIDCFKLAKVRYTLIEE